jgi:hypothetical protein
MAGVIQQIPHPAYSGILNRDSDQEKPFPAHKQKPAKGQEFCIELGRIVLMRPANPITQFSRGLLVLFQTPLFKSFL